MTKEELEPENKLLKSFLYCTEKSCNNCGYINCENFQRQRKNCCERWISFKDYIAELEAQIEKMKCLLNEIYSEFGFSELVKIRNNLPIEIQEVIKEIKEK